MATDESKDPTVIRTITKNLISMGVFASLTMGAVLLFFGITQERIMESRVHFEEDILHSLITNSGDPAKLRYVPHHLVPQAYSIYRAQQQLGTILTTITPDGYSGSIKLLVAIDNQGSIIGVRVTEHKETPGLGDKIETTKSLWSEQFIGTQLSRTRWDVKKHNGDFDALSGATISARAVIKAVEDSLAQWKEMARNE